VIDCTNSDIAFGLSPEFTDESWQTNEFPSSHTQEKFISSPQLLLVFPAIIPSESHSSSKFSQNVFTPEVL
jgi:hypothetical protein